MRGILGIATLVILTTVGVAQPSALPPLRIAGNMTTIELAPVARTVARSDLRGQVDLAADWRPRFAEAYRRELQSWVNAILAWHSADLKNVSGPVHGPDAWDGYRAAVIAETLLASMSSGGPVRVESLAIPGLYQQARS